MGSEVELCFWKMFSLLFLPSLALAWQPAPGIPLDRQLPVRSRQAAAPSSYEEVVCDYEPIIQECNATTQIWCDGGSYNGNSCWFGNYCVQKVSVWNGCPGVCHTPCNWETEHFCDMGTKAIGDNECWVGNWCQDISLGECPTVGCAVGVEASSSCSDPYESICEPDTQISCDGGHDSEGCWYGNYCIDQINEYDGCFGVCSVNCNYETEDWCDIGSTITISITINRLWLWSITIRSTVTINRIWLWSITIRSPVTIIRLWPCNSTIRSTITIDRLWLWRTWSRDGPYGWYRLWLWYRLWYRLWLWHWHRLWL